MLVAPNPGRPKVSWFPKKTREGDFPRGGVQANKEMLKGVSKNRGTPKWMVCNGKPN